MKENIEVLFHSSIRIGSEKVIYVDPFKIENYCDDADIIFVTHDHYDHYSEEDIEIVKNNETLIVAPRDLENKILKSGFDEDYVILVEPNRSYNIDEEFSFETIPAYNINKRFHPRENGWVGYILEIKGVRYYIAGDTDATDESKKVECDVALVPVGGTYTMNAIEAAELVNIIKPKVAVPIHYGSIVGTKQDAKEFVSRLNSEIDGKILMA